MEKVSIGKSYVYLTTAKFLSILAGYIIYIFIARLLDPAGFGVYSIIVGIVSVINMVILTGTIQSVSKFVSQDENSAEDVKNLALKLQLFIGCLIAGAYFLLAGVIAAVINDKSYIPYLRLSALIVLFYSFYAVFIGYLNGLRQFRKQSLFDMSYSILRAGLIIGLTLFTLTVMGAILGFVFASLIILISAVLIVGFKPIYKKSLVNYKDLIKFMLPTMGFVLISNLLLNIDLLSIKALSEASISNTLAGYYSAALSIARIPYFAVISLSLMILPLVSKATFDKNLEKTKYYINSSLRFSLILLVFLAVIISTNSKQLLKLLYPSVYSYSGSALTIAVFGLALLGLFLISTTIITGSGRPKTAFKLGLFVLILDVILNIYLVKAYSLNGAAMATTLAMLIGFIVSIIYIKKIFKTYLNLKSVIKILILGVIIYFISSAYEVNGFLLVIKILILSVLYLFALFILKEIRILDIKKLLKI